MIIYLLLLQVNNGSKKGTVTYFSIFLSDLIITSLWYCRDAARDKMDGVDEE